MSRDDLARLVLLEVLHQCEEVKSRPMPPTWKRWAVQAWEDDRAYGPSYTPTWFGDLTATEAGRIRILRTVYRLADAGLLAIVKTEGGRLCRVRLTLEGRVAAAALDVPLSVAVVESSTGGET